MRASNFNKLIMSSTPNRDGLLPIVNCMADESKCACTHKIILKILVITAIRDFIWLCAKCVVSIVTTIMLRD
ncbi:hypothetical protein AHA02nite_22390 [Alkalibacillus haloalkaliphilus]|uniref:Uncharacterized protein n=1 Tax=Alkalibacillus haloalkaliphilus TaxID=94136 RepID=A0A511W8T8_9BACI|nr:hypothetical protein AHA02nite_22390 [Alkalibacillus haloalkaliphilus]